MVTDFTYNAITTDFWANLDAVGPPETWEHHGLTGDAKGQPVQSNHPVTWLGAVPDPQDHRQETVEREQQDQQRGAEGGHPPRLGRRPQGVAPAQRSDPQKYKAPRSPVPRSTLGWSDQPHSYGTSGPRPLVAEQHERQRHHPERRRPSGTPRGR